MHLKEKNKISEIKWNLVGILGKFFIDLLFCTMKINSKGFEKVEPVISSRKFIFAFWHSRMLFFNYMYKQFDAAILASRSEDGEIAVRVLQKQGHEAIRGSTTRGGSRALVTLIKKLKERKRPAVIIPDGPQGPRFKVQPGIIILAKKTGYPILPVSYSAKKIKIFTSWDRFILPYPFTKCTAVYGDPLYVPQNADKDTENKCLNILEKELCRITFDADHYFGHNII